MLLGFLQYQRASVLKIVEGLPEDAWQTPVVSSGWTVAGMLWHLGGVEHHWLQHVTTGVMEEPPPGEEAGDEEEGTYDPGAAFTCGWPSADLIANYRDECRRSDEVLAVTPLSAAPRGLGFHPALRPPGDRTRTARRENQARRTLTRPCTSPPWCWLSSSRSQASRSRECRIGGSAFRRCSAPLRGSRACRGG